MSLCSARNSERQALWRSACDASREFSVVRTSECWRSVVSAACVVPSSLTVDAKVVFVVSRSPLVDTPHTRDPIKAKIKAPTIILGT